MDLNGFVICVIPTRRQVLLICVINELFDFVDSAFHIKGLFGLFIVLAV